MEILCASMLEELFELFFFPIVTSFHSTGATRNGDMSFLCRSDI